MIRMKSEINLNTMLVILVLLYFPTMLISNIVAIKVNYLIAMMAFSIACYITCKNKNNLLILFSLLIITSIKVMILGSYGLRPLMITVLGSVLLISFCESFDKIEKNKKEKYIKFIIGFSLSICFVIILQKTNILPVSIGKMSFLNTAGYNIFGEYESGYRVSSYFYHPYDTALAIIPLLVAFLSGSWHKAIISAFFVSIVLMMLGLKILIAFSIAYILINRHIDRFSSKRYIFSLMALLTILVMIVPFFDFSSDDVAFTAGRLVIWKIMIIEWLEKSSYSTLLMGSNFDVLSESLLWSSDESYTPHNQFLYNILYLGVVYYLYFLYFFYKALSVNNNLNVFLILMMLTFCNTGDLFSFLGFWVASSLVYAVLSKDKKYEEIPLKMANPA